MSKKTEALKLALEALECKDGWGSSSRVLKERAITSLRTALSASRIEGDLMQRFYDGEEAKSLISEAEETITALREALAEQPAQHPDEFRYPLCYDDPANIKQPAQQQEPVVRWVCKGCRHEYMEAPSSCDCMESTEYERVEYFTSPAASKPWVGLSTDEIYDMYNEPRSDAEMVEFARAIEAKLREKNHG